MKVIKLTENAVIPTRKHSTDAGLDLCSVETGIVLPHSNKIFHTGIAVEIPENYAGFIWPKSRHNFLIGGGVIDYGYQGEILVNIINPFDYTIYIGEGQAIAQLVIQQVYLCGMELVEHFEKRTERGATGGILEQGSDISREQYKKQFNEYWKDKDLPDQYNWNKPDIT